MYRKIIIMSSKAASSSASSMLLLDFFNRRWQYVANDSALKFEFFAFPVTAFRLTYLVHALSSAPLKPTSVLNCSRTIFAYFLWTESNAWMYFLGSYAKMKQMKFEISISLSLEIIYVQNHTLKASFIHFSISLCPSFKTCSSKIVLRRFTTGSLWMANEHINSISSRRTRSK